MKTLIIIAIVILIIFFLMQIRVGGSADYSADGFSAEALIACFHIKLYPRPKLTPVEREKNAEAKAKKDEKKKAKKVKSEEKKSGKKKTENVKLAESSANKLGGKIDLILDLLPVLGKLLSGLGRKIRINRLDISLSVGGGDAAAVAIAYGKISSVGPYIISWAEKNMDLHEHHIQVTPDFLSGASTIAVHAKLTYTIGQLLWIILKAALSALTIYLKHKKNRKNTKTNNKAVS